MLASEVEVLLRPLSETWPAEFAEKLPLYAGALDDQHPDDIRRVVGEMASGRTQPPTCAEIREACIKRRRVVSPDPLPASRPEMPFPPAGAPTWVHVETALYLAGWLRWNDQERRLLWADGSDEALPRDGGGRTVEALSGPYRGIPGQASEGRNPPSKLSVGT